MDDNKLTTNITINASAADVWKGLTDPEMIEQYFFGTRLVTDWQPGSLITWTGEWQGKQYQDKGKVIEIQPGHFVKYTYWSSMSGTEDRPENYANVTYKLTEEGDLTHLELTQDNIKTEDAKKHSEQSWQTVLGGLKKLIEKP